MIFNENNDLVLSVQQFSWHFVKAIVMAANTRIATVQGIFKAAKSRFCSLHGTLPVLNVT
jgi:hypothetical protein